MELARGFDDHIWPEGPRPPHTEWGVPKALTQLKAGYLGINPPSIYRGMVARTGSEAIAEAAVN